jgi:FAD/FMN-containing dehydrogenase
VNPDAGGSLGRLGTSEGDAEHRSRRERMLAGLRSSRGTQQPFALAKDTSNLFRDPSRDARRRLDLREFNHVLAVDAADGWVEAEGMTTYDDLVTATLQHGALPAVVPELKTITLGGAAAGVGIEASSFRYGLVHETLLELDVLTAGGRVLTCRADNEYADLFFGFPNSYGTLGYAVKLKARIVRAKPLVALEHRRFDRREAFFAALEARSGDGIDFVDGVAFGPGDFCLTTGRFVDSAPYVSDYSFERIYYRSIRERTSDFLTAHDYIWRWDTDWFWCSKNIGAQIPWVRRLYGRERLGSRTYQRIMRWNSRWGMTKALDRLRGGHSESVIQDVDIPIENAAAFLDFFQREIGIAPVWTCPLIGRESADRFPLYGIRPGALYVNFGFWDVLRRRGEFAPHHFNGLIEDKVLALGGIKSLYSESFFDRAAFDRTYGGDAYRALKAKYDPDGAFPGLYQKAVAHA